MRRFALPLAWLVLSASALLCSPFGSRARADDGAGAVGIADSAGSAPTSTPEPAADSAKADEEGEAREREWDLRAGTTYFGPAGGIYVVDAASGPAGSFRLQAITDFFVAKDYLYDGDKDRYVGSALALGVTPIKYLELSAAFSSRANHNSRTEPNVLQTIGDMSFDVKAWGEPTRGLNLGGDAQLVFRSGPNKVGIEPSGTSIGLRGNLSLDLRRLTRREAPLILRGNFGYFFDNSAKMIEATEATRFANLRAQGVVTATNSKDEYRHLVRRDERLAFGINRVDHAIVALGLEVPIKAAERFSIHPIAEWQLDIPVNRQGYDCPFVTGLGNNKLGGTDSCLADEGVDTFTQRITAGARLYPGLPGLSILLAAELGVGGTTNFVQELAPNAPYRVILAAGYTVDVKKKKPEVVIKEVEKRIEVPIGAALGRVKGTILEQGADGVVVANARVAFPGREASRLLTEADGSFISPGFAPGEVQIEVEADGYEPGNCTASVPAAGGDVSLACMIVALPRVGSALLQVSDAKAGAQLAAVSVAVTGPGDAKNLNTDVEGRLRLTDLKPGEYKARIEHPGYLISVTPFVVKPREETSVAISVTPVPKVSSIRIQGAKLQVKGTIYFTPDTASIEARSNPLLAEIASLLMNHPELLQVEVQGHTDDTGSASRNAQLSEERARAVKEWLTQAGVERDRLLAKGYGAEKPVAPNVTEQNRARNRRVEFAILRRAGK